MLGIMSNSFTSLRQGLSFKPNVASLANPAPVNLSGDPHIPFARLGLQTDHDANLPFFVASGDPKSGPYATTEPSLEA